LICRNPAVGARRYIDRSADHRASIMSKRLPHLLRIAAFVLATLSATSALIAAGLNEDAAAPSAQQGR